MKDKGFKTKQWGLVVAFIAVVISISLLLLQINSLSTKGPIGDAIAGTTAPIIGLVTAILLYRSFREQLTANKLLSDQQLYNDKITYANQWGEYIEKQIDQIAISDTELDVTGESAMRFLNNNLFSKMNYGFSFYYEIFQRDIPERLANIAVNITELSIYIRKNDLLKSSFRAYQLYHWMRLFDNMDEQIKQIQKESDKNKDAGLSRFGEDNYLLKMRSEKDQQDLQILFHDISELYKEAKIYLKATGKDF